MGPVLACVSRESQLLAFACCGERVPSGAAPHPLAGGEFHRDRLVRDDRNGSQSVRHGVIPHHERPLRSHVADAIGEGLRAVRRPTLDRDLGVDRARCDSGGARTVDHRRWQGRWSGAPASAHPGRHGPQRGLDLSGLPAGGWSRAHEGGEPDDVCRTTFPPRGVRGCVPPVEGLRFAAIVALICAEGALLVLRIEVVRQAYRSVRTGALAGEVA